MGLLDRWRNRSEPTPDINYGRLVAAKTKKDADNVGTFDNSILTYTGDIEGFDYSSILKDKQGNIQSLFQLADYFSDADPICHAINYHVFVPFCTSSKWFLTGGNEKTIKIYEDYYKSIRLQEKIDDIAVQLAKYNNVYIYLLNGVPITLPVNKIRVGNTQLNGQPILEMDIQSIQNEWRQKGYSIRENWVKDSDLEYAFKGYPEEVQKAINAGVQYAQLNPDYTFAVQGPKEGWLRYAVPWIASALPALSRKKLIMNYENSMLELKSRSFVHVRYGDEKAGQDVLPGREELVAVRNIFKQAMNGLPLAVTNQLAKAEVISPDIDDLYQFPIYTQVNEDIMTAGGVASIIATGTSNEGSTFSTAQVSMQTAEARINAMRNEICDIMTRINEKLTEFIDGTYNLKETPVFHFEPLDMTGKKALRETCLDLWDKGVVSTRTMLETHGYSIEEETRQREKEASENIDKTLVSREVTNSEFASKQEKETKNGVGRPKEDESNPDTSNSGSMPKPSQPKGSGVNKT